MCEQISLVKVILLGDSNVGKTSLVNRYTNDCFTNSLLTIGIDVRKVVRYLYGRTFRLQLWDTAGQQKYKILPAQYFRGIHAVMLVYDVTSSESFFRIEDWLSKITNHCDVEKVIMMLVGTKIDLKDGREVREEDAAKFAKDRHMKFKETSAKLAINIQQMMSELIDEVIKRGVEAEERPLKLQIKKLKKEEDGDGCC